MKHFIHQTLALVLCCLIAACVESDITSPVAEEATDVPAVSGKAEVPIVFARVVEANKSPDDDVWGSTLKHIVFTKSPEGTVEFPPHCGLLGGKTWPLQSGVAINPGNWVAKPIQFAHIYDLERGTKVANVTQDSKVCCVDEEGSAASYSSPSAKFSYHRTVGLADITALEVPDLNILRATAPTDEMNWVEAQPMLVTVHSSGVSVNAGVCPSEEAPHEGLSLKIDDSSDKQVAFHPVGVYMYGAYRVVGEGSIIQDWTVDEVACCSDASGNAVPCGDVAVTTVWRRVVGTGFVH